jgi:hypothetical protein
LNAAVGRLPFTAQPIAMSSAPTSAVTKTQVSRRRQSRRKPGTYSVNGTAIP